MNGFAAGPENAFDLSLKRVKMSNMLEHIRAEDKIKMMIRKRDLEAIIFNHRVHALLLCHTGNIDGRDGESSFRQRFGLPAHAGADFQYGTSRWKHGNHVSDLMPAQTREMFEA